MPAVRGWGRAAGGTGGLTGPTLVEAMSSFFAAKRNLANLAAREGWKSCGQVGPSWRRLADGARSTLGAPVFYRSVRGCAVPIRASGWVRLRCAALITTRASSCIVAGQGVQDCKARASGLVFFLRASWVFLRAPCPRGSDAALWLSPSTGAGARTSGVPRLCQPCGRRVTLKADEASDIHCAFHGRHARRTCTYDAQPGHPAHSGRVQ